MTAAKSAAAKPPKSGKLPLGDARLTANIRSDLHLRLKIRAAQEHTTAGELIEQWIASWNLVKPANGRRNTMVKAPGFEDTTVILDERSLKSRFVKDHSPQYNDRKTREAFNEAAARRIESYYGPTPVQCVRTGIVIAVAAVAVLALLVWVP